MPVGVGVVRTRRRDEALDVLAEALVQEHLLVDGGAQLDDSLLRHQRVQADALEVEVDELLFLLRRQVPDVHHDGEAIGRRFGERKRALAELHRDSSSRWRS